ncbi:hypothetical protein K439DRAFT_1630165 [Ramaria rubella]|nr:hypothetical protein K439DRAFT_1630165 [Ramaria rubella]
MCPASTSHATQQQQYTYAHYTHTPNPTPPHGTPPYIPSTTLMRRTSEYHAISRQQ